MADRAAPAARSPLRQALPFAGLVAGVWAILAPYTLLGPDLNAASKNEVADHVVPGVLMLAVALAMLALRRRGAESGTLPLVGGFVYLLAGLWMSATHLPLVRDAGNGVVADGVAAWHTVPGLVVLALGAVWSAAWWSAAAD